MDSPPRDDSTADDGDSESSDRDDSESPDHGDPESLDPGGGPDGSSDDSGVPTEEFDPSTSRSETAETGTPEPESGGPATAASPTAGTGPATGETDTKGGDFDDPIGDLLPRASVDSRWWYWIAAIPLYVALGGLLAVLFIGAFLFDLFLTGGIVTIFGAFVVVPIVGLLGLVLSVMYPIATYVDARAIAESDASWSPDPLVWGLAALATEVLSAFTLSIVLALYYLYKRHVAVGTP